MQGFTYSNYTFLKDLGIGEDNLGCYKDGTFSGNGGHQISVNPATNKPIAKIRLASEQDYAQCIEGMKSEKARWMLLPAPERGEIVR
jgi:acyl-CoA reductase-like NAD-dependent aldehyde dehydrogenase